MFVDASPVGLGAILTQVTADGGTNIVAYASQAANHDPKPVREPLHMSTLPLGPWQELSVDFCGPFSSGDYLLVGTDDFSRYPEVEILRSTSAKAVIPHLDSIFNLPGRECLT